MLTPAPSIHPLSRFAPNSTFNSPSPLSPFLPSSTGQPELPAAAAEWRAEGESERARVPSFFASSPGLRYGARFGAPQGPSVSAQLRESCCITALSLVWPNLVEYSQSLQRGAIPPAPPRSLLRRSVVHKSRSWRHLCNFEKKRKRGRDRVSLSLGGRAGGHPFPPLLLSLLCSKTGRNFALPLPLSPSHSSGCRFVEGENGESLSAQSFTTLLGWDE